MRIMIDSNILISAALYPDSVLNIIIDYIEKRHEMIICDYVLAEMKNVFIKSFRMKSPD